MFACLNDCLLQRGASRALVRTIACLQRALRRALVRTIACLQRGASRALFERLPVCSAAPAARWVRTSAQPAC
jgi:hypothetical protein